MENNGDTQRILEQKALANVRALVEKVEAEDRNRTKNAVGFAFKIIPAALIVVVLGGVLIGLVTRKEKPHTVPARTHDEYVERVFATIEKRANAGMRPEMRGMNGRVQVGFKVRPNGYIDALEVRGSSWNADVDRKATRIVKASEPFERIPKDVASGPIEVLATLSFVDSGGKGTSLSIERAPAGAPK